MCKKIFTILRQKLCLSGLRFIQYVDMIQLSAQIEPVDLEALQVIVKSD